MERGKIWDLYFLRLHKLLVREEDKIKKLIKKETKKEIPERWKDIDKKGVEAYIDVAISFIEERLYAYNLDRFDRFLKVVTTGGTLADLDSIDSSLTWYDWKQEKRQIDAKIETGLNIKQMPKDIIDDLLDEFGAFPNKSIIQQYLQKPEKNHLPDYILAIAIQKVIRERQG